MNDYQQSYNTALGQYQQQMQNAQAPYWIQNAGYYPNSIGTAPITVPQITMYPNPLVSLIQQGLFMADGKKPLVVCNGEVVEAKDMDDAQRIAEEKAHQKSANAYILKPVKQIAPKRDVVTTDL